MMNDEEKQFFDIIHQFFFIAYQSSCACLQYNLFGVSDAGSEAWEQINFRFRRRTGQVAGIFLRGNRPPVGVRFRSRSIHAHIFFGGRFFVFKGRGYRTLCGGFVKRLAALRAAPSLLSTRVPHAPHPSKFA